MLKVDQLKGLFITFGVIKYFLTRRNIIRIFVDKFKITIKSKFITKIVGTNREYNSCVGSHLRRTDSPTKLVF